MAKYRVDVLELQGRGKKVYKAGDVVSDNCFPEGNAKELLKKGYLKSVKLTKKEQAVENATNAVKDAKLKLVDAQSALEGADEGTQEDMEAAVETAQAEFDEATEALAKLTK